MRIISGQRRGLKLKSPKGDHTRPTESRVKESIFNILANVSGSKVLDLFAGSGSIGLEFLSRDADLCYFVESDKLALKSLEDNLSKANLGKYKIFPYDSIKALKYISKGEIIFNYIYIDPPYDRVSLYDKSLEIIHKNHQAFGKALIIVEADKSVKIDKLPLFSIKDKRNYRDTVIYFLRRK